MSLVGDLILISIQIDSSPHSMRLFRLKERQNSFACTATIAPNLSIKSFDGPDKNFFFYRIFFF